MLETFLQIVGAICAINLLYLFIASLLVNKFNVPKGRAFFLWGDGICFLITIIGLAIIVAGVFVEKLFLS
jgi:hypothetical protein